MASVVISLMFIVMHGHRCHVPVSDRAVLGMATATGELQLYTLSRSQVRNVASKESDSDMWGLHYEKFFSIPRTFFHYLDSLTLSLVVRIKSYTKLIISSPKVTQAFLI